MKDSFHIFLLIAVMSSPVLGEYLWYLFTH